MKKYGKGLGMGWHYESQRHSLARQGIKTSNRRFDYAEMPHSSATPNDTVSIKTTVEPLKVNELKDFLHKKFSHAVSKQPEHIQNSKPVIEAHKDIEHINSWQKFKQWATKHKPTLVLMGMGGLFGFIGLAGGLPTVMRNTATGEVVSIGGTLLGRAGLIAQTIFTGAGAMAEARIIEHDISEKYRKLFFDEQKKSLISPNDVKVAQKAVVLNLNPRAISYMRLDGHDSGSEPESYGDLAKMSSSPIPFDKLTLVERKNLFTAMQKVKRLFRSMGKDVDLNEDNLQVVKRVGPDDSAWGGHQGQLIQIDRDILTDPDKTEGVVAHEMTHRVYNVRDETRDLENIDIDIIGKLL